MSEKEESGIILQNQVSSLKLMKMSKGYNWEIKIYDEDPEVLFKKVQELDCKMREEYSPDE